MSRRSSNAGCLLALLWPVALVVLFAVVAIADVIAGGAGMIIVILALLLAFAYWIGNRS